MVTAARNSRKWQVEVTPEMEAGACGMVRPLDTHHAHTARIPRSPSCSSLAIKCATLLFCW